MNGGLIEPITQNEGGAKEVCYKLRIWLAHVKLYHKTMALQDFAIGDMPG
jgi:hypothetical protein